MPKEWLNINCGCFPIGGNAAFLGRVWFLGDNKQAGGQVFGQTGYAT